ncbi:MBOAT family O-acyltransferase [Helicobacter sp. 'house sparrow 1']|uniref:MBOAT family O-acyltransferase n=1 Tax=Helicobacter sp. 'house sparrow 1' TaxID=2020247 RepID=UPI001F18F347|nr:MBOAT family O-acyltransferase [Helicobacter sp. 'house sparrow 1']
MVLASLFFYSYWNVVYLPLLLGSILFNYTVSIFICRFRKISKILFIFALIVNIGLLCYFKYMDFFIENLNFVFGTNFNLLHIILPLGISFFTITQIAYLVDCYEGLVEERNLVNYTLFVTFFPHLIAGPILHHKQMMPQFADNKKKRLNFENIAKGIFIFSLGLFKKVIIADTFSQWANAGFNIVDNGGVLNFFEAWVTLLSYALQLYFDFSGYCDMAIGLGLLFNINLPVNFNSPFKATNIIDFWKRWHISLTNFITTYIYTPIIRTFRKASFGVILYSTFVTFVIAGVWHGSGWNFFIFGCIHGIALVINHFWQKRIKIKMLKPLGWLLMMFTILIAWVFFRAESFQGALNLLRSLLGISWVSLPEGKHLIPSLLRNINGSEFTIAMLIIGFMMCLCFKNSIEKMQALKTDLKTALFTAFLLAVGILGCVGVRYQEFIYFNF